jgi:hypothetical protein
MGEVYRARDPRLSREVAIKILPETTARDPDRVARFEREARLLASLSHPHIAAVHGFEQGNGHLFLVLELVPGLPLAERLAKAPLEVREALSVARQIAEALEEAHAKGVIHRDLKPSNVKITPEGRVKVLDFGLAKAFGEQKDASAHEDTPTVARTVESGGVLLGTPGYMSPEQARGQDVDKRSDIWASGCVLYEMLTGRKLFDGPSITDTLAAVLTAEPDWSRLPPVPPLVLSLLRRCLQKDRASRLHDIGDARIEIEEAMAEIRSGIIPFPPRTSSPSGRRLAAHVFAFLVGALVGAFAVSMLRGSTPTIRSAALLNIDLPAEGRLLAGLQGILTISLSRDGTRLVYVGRRPDGLNQIFLRRMDRLNPEPVAGTESARMPFLSPDGELAGFCLRREAQEGALERRATAGHLRRSRPAWCELGRGRNDPSRPEQRRRALPRSSNGRYPRAGNGARPLTERGRTPVAASPPGSPNGALQRSAPERAGVPAEDRWSRSRDR